LKSYPNTPAPRHSVFAQVTIRPAQVKRSVNWPWMTKTVFVIENYVIPFLGIARTLSYLFLAHHAFSDFKLKEDTFAICDIFYFSVSQRSVWWCTPMFVEVSVGLLFTQTAFRSRAVLVLKESPCVYSMLMDVWKIFYQWEWQIAGNRPNDNDGMWQCFPTFLLSSQNTYTSYLLWGVRCKLSGSNGYENEFEVNRKGTCCYGAPGKCICWGSDGKILVLKDVSSSFHLYELQEPDHSSVVLLQISPTGSGPSSFPFPTSLLQIDDFFKTQRVVENFFLFGNKTSERANEQRVHRAGRE
jgi:hypothetical protein